MLKMTEIKSWDSKLINTKIEEFRSELVQIKMQKVTSGIEKPHRLKEIRSDIARLMTVLSSKK